MSPAPLHGPGFMWSRDVARAVAEGGRVNTPNGLPVRSIRFDGLMSECSEGDHATYLFPVDVTGENDARDAADGHAEYPQLHALIYTDGVIALTLYEANYAIWSVRDGAPRGGRYQRDHERLSTCSREKIASLELRPKVSV